MKIVYVPTVNDETEDFIKLFKFYASCFEDSQDVELDFSNCKFLRQNGVVLVGGIIKLGERIGKSITIDEDSIQSNIYTNLCQNGFAQAFLDSDNSPWKGNSIPYYEFSEGAFNEIQTYLNEKWLGRGWINIDEELKDDIVTRIFELYANSLEHSSSDIGCFSCGQHFGGRQELTLSLVDFGKGIPHTVIEYHKGAITDTLEAMKWAFEEGNSTRDTSRTGYRGGMGLSLVENFLTLNGGCMEIYSNDCLYSIQGEKVSFIKTDYNFMGTFINIKLLKDTSFYSYKK